MGSNQFDKASAEIIHADSSPTYHQRYAEFLKIDFLRVPMTSKPDLFRRLCAW